jgi:acyl-coenzyme A thioesterase PaaI-like protein
MALAQRNWIRDIYDKVGHLPGGKLIFGKALGLYVPYTGSLGAEVQEVRKGHSRVHLDDRRAVRNHLNCIHAIALANLAELTGNLALIYSMPDDARFIVAGLDIEYLKKARGRITATCDCPVPATSDKAEYRVPVELKNAEGELVARCTLRTLIGPKK